MAIHSHANDDLVVCGDLLSASDGQLKNDIQNTRLEALDLARKATHRSFLSSAMGRRRCIEGTGTEALSRIDQWLYGNHVPSVYWINGIEGSGKTTIAYTFSERLERRGLLAASFFCTHTSADCCDITRILPTIAYQLSRYSVPFRAALYDVLGEEPHAVSPNMELQFQRLIREPLKKVEETFPSNVVVVIDGLDECSDRSAVETWFNILCRYAADIPLRFFITSRPVGQEIRERIMHYARSWVALELREIELSPTREDIARYFQEELESLSPPPVQLAQLVDRCDLLPVHATNLARYIKSGNRRADWHNRLRSVLEVTPEVTRAQRYFLTMRENLRFNICGLESSCVPDKMVHNLQGRIEQKISPALVDACQSWGSRLASAAYSEILKDMLKDFTCHQLFFWMEVLSLRGELVTGAENLLKAKQWLDQQAPIRQFEMERLIVDAHNFVVEFSSSPISRFTPHIYISALPFYPRSRSIRTHYWRKTQGLLELKGTTIKRSGSAVLDTWNVGSAVESVAYSPDGTQVAAGCKDNTIRILNAHGGTPLFGPLQGHTGFVYSVAFSPDGKFVASGSADRTILIWNAYNGQQVAGPFTGHTNEVSSVSFSPDGRRIVSGSWDNTIRLTNIHHGVITQGPLKGHSDWVCDVVFSPDGALIASASNDRSVRLWNSCNGAHIACLFKRNSSFEGFSYLARCVAFTPNGAYLVSGFSDGDMRAWKTSDRSLITSSFEGHKDTIYSVAISPDSTRVASGSGDRTVRVWSINDGKLIAGPFFGHTWSVSSVAYSPDGTRVISGSGDGTIRVWNITFPFQELQSVSFSSVVTSILFHFHGQTTWAWDLPRINAFPDTFDRIPSRQISSPEPLSRACYACSATNYSILVLGSNNHSLISGPLYGHTDQLTSYAFSDDFNYLVTGSRDCTIRLWDLSKGMLAADPFCGHTAEVSAVDLAYDCSRIVSCSNQDETIRVWNVDDPVIKIRIPTVPFPDSMPAPHELHILRNWKVQEDGWIVDDKSNPLIWIPSSIASSGVRPSPHTELIITNDYIWQIPQQELAVGTQWT
ncbi:unnamed protein product [Rhizoctonia solani]|uniref:NACHT domain-containing protein n=1 Tax=Rhizoctonia solani TaxID=456999 RepID=A0A8H2Y4D1_9AGAM|nr:unnamed protein product [Rhizoctonia solani]